MIKGIARGVRIAAFGLFASLMILLSIPSGSVMAAECEDTDTSFFGLPPWYRGLCKNGVVELGNDIPLNEAAYTIGLNVADAAIRIASIVAVGLIVYGGFLYITAQGDKAKIETAQKTLQTAVVGLVITVMASAIVGFIIAKITKG